MIYEYEKAHSATKVIAKRSRGRPSTSQRNKEEKPILKPIIKLPCTLDEENSKSLIKCLTKNEPDGDKRMFEITWKPTRHGQKAQKEALSGKKIKAKYGQKFLLDFYEKAYKQ